MRTLSRDEAQAYYDRFGRKQDLQAFYEDAALAALRRQARLAESRRVFELGCGTGRFAAELLEGELPPDARYVGGDVSATMLGLARARLAPYGGRAALVRLAGQELPLATSSVDRFACAYVLDLLSSEAARRVVDEAWRVLVPGGLLCVVGITRGTTAISRAVMTAWEWVFRANPAWVGGCRPLSSEALVRGPAWTVRFHDVVVRWGVASEVTIAARE